MSTLEWRILRGRSVGPTFNADFLKSLFAHLAELLFALFAVADFDGDSLFGAGGGSNFVLGDFCFVSEIGGLFDFDLLLLLVAFDVVFVKLLRDDTDEAFDDTELSRDFDWLFSPFSGDSRDVDFVGETLLPLLLLLLNRPYDNFDSRYGDHGVGARAELKRQYFDVSSIRSDCTSLSTQLAILRGRIIVFSIVLATSTRRQRA